MLGTMIGARSGNAKRIAEADVVSGKEQTMSKDIIYREDAIKAIEELPNAYNGWSDAYDKAYIIGTLEEVPKADRRQGEWIPCSERLPSEQGQYLVTFPLFNGDPCVYVLSFCKGKFYDGEWGDVEYDDVTAWMPLPKPYGEREGE